jgi:hypothetical protein
MDSSNNTRVPKLDKRSYREIFDELISCAKFYVPEWDSSNESDIGVALSKIFSHIMVNVTDRLNKVPYRNYIEFLNVLGTKLSPAMASSADITFLPSQGVQDQIQVRSGSRIAAPANDKHAEMIFETQENLLVTNSELVDIWSVSGSKTKKDGLFEHTQNHIERLPFSLFFGTNKQKHILYLMDQIVFNTKIDSQIVIRFSSNNANALSAVLNNSDWEYNWKPDADNVDQENTSKFYAETTQDKNICIVRLSFIKKGQVMLDKYVLKVGDILNLDVEQGGNAEETKVIVKSSTDLTGKIIDLKQLPESEMLHGSIKLVSKATISSRKYDEDILLVEEGDLVTVTYKIKGHQSTSAAVVNSKGNPKIDETEVNNITGYWIRCLLPPQNFVPLQDSIKSLTIDDIKIGSLAISDPFKPEIDVLIFNNVILKGFDNPFQQIFPFGEKPAILDTFYIASQSVLSRKNAIIKLSFTCSDNSSLMLKSVPVLSWEYWNGNTWVSLTVQESPNAGLNISNVTSSNASPSAANLTVPQLITFLCPTDISQTDVNGLKNFWIRSRIVNGDYGKEKLVPDTQHPPVYSVNTDDILYPKIFNIKLSFDQAPKQPENCISYNNLENSDSLVNVDGTIKPFTPFYGLPNVAPEIYFGFNKQIKQGPLNIYFSVHKFACASSNISTSNNPSSIKYYYYSDSRSWKELSVLDGTGDYIKSGYVKVIVPPDISEYSLFGNKRCWIKAVDTRFIFESAIKEEKYCPDPIFVDQSILGQTNRTLPYINGIFVNTVRSMNLTKIDEEIVGSSSGEQNQTFKFSKAPVVSSDILQTRIWINEARAISAEDVENLKKLKEIREVKDLGGLVREIWVQ